MEKYFMIFTLILFILLPVIGVAYTLYKSFDDSYIHYVFWTFAIVLTMPLWYKFIFTIFGLT